MGERYLVTGVQFGMLIALTRKERQHMIEDIINTQFICDTDNTDVELDTITISNDYENGVI